MLSLSHTLISLPFGLAFSNPVVAFIGALLMHLVSDMPLHWNIYPENYKKYPFFLVGIDVVLGLAVSFVLLGNTMFSLSVLAAIAGGNTPDALHAFWKFMSLKKRKSMPRFIQNVFAFHENIQWETESPLVGGLSQVLFCAVAIALTISLR